MSLDDRFFCDKFIDKTIKNVKGRTNQDRFIDIISDPNNLLIARCKNAGKIEENNVVLHNGIKVVKDGYYGDFSDILILNKGCHEPAEERMFTVILADIRENGVMIELGSYWAFYSIWFNKAIKGAKNYCIEPSGKNLELGKTNCAINNVVADFTLGFIGKGHINITEFVKEKNIDYIDILHSDIQGYEVEMLEDITGLLDKQKIKYLFISTHNDRLHYNCIKILKEHNYRIIASADFGTETFCSDGIIVACHKDNLRFDEYYIGNRKHTQLRTVPY